MLCSHLTKRRVRARVGGKRLHLREYAVDFRLQAAQLHEVKETKQLDDVVSVALCVDSTRHVV